jgi:hypothetical protein
MIVEANNLKVKTIIESFESTNEEETCKNVSPCSIVVTEAEDDKVDDETDKNANRRSIVSNSSIESSRSDDDPVNVEHGSSVFYVVWD